MKKFKLSALLIYAMILGFSACGGGGGGSDDPGNPDNPGGDKTISISVINGVTPPACGETPVSVITANAQFSGTVSWNISTAKFAANTVYTATIELTAKSGYTLDGVSDDFFEVSGASVVKNDADSGIITAEFPATGSAPPTVVSIKAISGVTAPVRDAIPVTSITETAQYTGTISWSGSPAKFAASTVYTATITLTAKTGYTFNGISADYFMVSGATTVTNSGNTGVITAVFPATEALTATFTEVINDNTYAYTLPDGTVFNAMLTPDISTSNTFPCNIDADRIYDEATDVANVPSRFIIGETEVTYELWCEVYKWATTDLGSGFRTDGGVLYSFDNEGTSFGIKGITPTTAKLDPVIYINWRDTIVWCNALTEYYNANNGSGTDLVCVYTYNGSIIRDSRDSNATACDYVVQSPTAKGFRLPTSTEWEFAARYRGNDSVNAIAGSDGTYYTKGNSASGATADYNNVSATSAVAVYDVSFTAAVKTKTANTLGLCDMSGNVYEWCFDWHPDYTGACRVFCGGSCCCSADAMQVGRKCISVPYREDYVHYMGFRFCRSR